MSCVNILQNTSRDLLCASEILPFLMSNASDPPAAGERQGSLLLVRDSTLLCQKIPCQD